MRLQDGTREKTEIVDLLVAEASEECRVLELQDGYLAAVLSPCLGPDEDAVVRLILAAPDMLAMLEEAAKAEFVPQDFRKRANAIVSTVRAENSWERDGAQELGSQRGHARD